MLNLFRRSALTDAERLDAFVAVEDDPVEDENGYKQPESDSELSILDMVIAASQSSGRSRMDVVADAMRQIASLNTGNRSHLKITYKDSRILVSETIIV